MNKTKVIVITVGIIITLCMIFIAKKASSMTAPLLTLTSSSFENGAKIPSSYTCAGENISPALKWTMSDDYNVKSYVLIVDDPDAQRVAGKTFVHWIALLSESTTQLPEGISGKIGSSLRSIDAYAIEIPNHYNKRSYNGPCPPHGSGVHTYRFTLFATKELLKNMNGSFFNAPFTAEEFEHTMGNAIVATARITGTYEQ